MILELVLEAYAQPAVVLDTVFHTIKGEPGSRYYKVTRRNTRCVTVDYENMHVDFTPAVRLRDPQRTGGQAGQGEAVREGERLTASRCRKS